MAENDEKELIARISGGDHDSYRLIVRRYKDSIYSMIMRQLGVPSMAEELTQEVFIKAYRNLHQFRGDSSFSTWLVRIAINHTTTYLSSRSHRNQQKTEPFDATLHARVAGSPEEILDRQERLMQFRRCFSKIGVRFQEVVTVIGLEGRSYQEGAELLGVPVGTIRSRLNKARLLIKECIERSTREGV